MTPRRTTRGLLLAATALGAACKGPAEPLVLQWSLGHGEDWPTARAGLFWALSEVGAVPDAASITVIADDGDRVRFTVDPDALRLPPPARAVWDDVVAECLASDEVAALGTEDAGRFAMRLVYDPGRYLDATAACGSVSQWSAVDALPLSYVSDGSSVTGRPRAIRLTDTGDPSAMGFLAIDAATPIEGAGPLEIVDVLASGQQRFAAYDQAGQLLPASAVAGPPGRCMWCHEDKLMTPITGTATTDSALSTDAFVAAIHADQQAVLALRRSLPTAVDYERHEVHEWAERLVLDFTEPSEERVAREWGVAPADVAALHLPVHASADYPDQTGLLTRADVDAAFGGGSPLPTLADFRSLGASEGTAPSGARCRPRGE